MANVNAIAQGVIDAFTTEDGFDFEGFKETVAILTKERVARKAEGKVQAKAIKEANAVELAEAGKAYVDTLGEGAEIAYTMADGTIVNGTLVKYSDKTVTVRLPADSPLLVGKDTSRKNYDCRYVKFDKIVVPTEAAEEAVA